MKRITPIVMAGGLLLSPLVLQAAELDDVTMEVIDVDSERPDPLMRRIELPPAASDTAREHSAQGLEQANQVRERNRERHQEHINDVNEDARNAREQAREERQEAIEEQREAVQEQVQERREDIQQQQEQMRDMIQEQQGNGFGYGQ